MSTLLLASGIPHNTFSSQDRNFNFRWCKPSGQTSVSGYYSSSYYPTNFGGSGYFSAVCPSNTFISSVSSYHDNTYNDRKFRILCRGYSLHSTTSCYWTGYENSYEASFSVQYSDEDRVIKGISSQWSSYYEDRIFNFYVCRLYNSGGGYG